MAFVARWISIKTASEYLSPHPQTVYQLFYKGKISGVRIGGAIRIDFQALQAGLEAQVRNRGKDGR